MTEEEPPAPLYHDLERERNSITMMGREQHVDPSLKLSSFETTAKVSSTDVTTHRDTSETNGAKIPAGREVRLAEEMSRFSRFTSPSKSPRGRASMLLQCIDLGKSRRESALLRIGETVKW